MLRGLLLVLVLLPALSAPAEAGVPPRFFGVMADGPLFDSTTDLDRELRLMRTTGVRTIRVAFDWRHAEPARGRHDYSEIDRVVKAAARRRLAILPVVLWAPEWARRDPGETASPPAPRPYAEFVAQLARRYGPGGGFWRSHRSLPRVPLREWQVWNEPTVTNFWTLQPWAEDYVELLARTRRALRRVDRGGRIVSAGFVYKSWRAVEKLYRAGGRGRFDVLAIHPFTEKPRNVLRIVALSREVMERFRDPHPIFLTEVSWPSSLDKIGRRYGYETDERGMAKKIRAAYPLIAGARRRLGIERTYWYTWLTRETDPAYPFDYAGLRKVRKDGRIVAKAGLAAFRRVVAALRR
jgi:hypothetical protein